MTTRILVLGGGYIGLYTCLGLEKRLRPGEAEVTLVSPVSYMTYQPFLPEAAAGNIEPRHVVVPLRRTLKKTRLITGRAVELDHQRRRARVAVAGGDDVECNYDLIVIGLGSIARVLPVAGLEEHGVGFTSIEEAIYLRNQVLSRMDLAESSPDPDVRRRALTFVFVGAGYSGVEALAELEDLARDACRFYRNVTRADMRWVLVEAADRILPELDEGLANKALGRLRARDIEVFLRTRLSSAQDGRIVLDNTESFPADTLVWTAGVKPHPLIARTGLPTDERGRVQVDATMLVSGTDNAWAAGDCAAVPELGSGAASPPTAQFALRQARLLAKNIVSALRGRPATGFRYRNLGSLVSLGRYKGVAKVMGIKLSGFPAWFMHRTYHVLMIPTFNRKVHVLVDWTVALFFRRDIVQLGSLTHPREGFSEAAGGKDEGGAA